MISMNPVVGIDCGKRNLDAALFPGTDRTRIENTPQGLAILVRWLAERNVGVAGLEASGGCERLARDALIEVGLTVRIFEPGRVRHFAGAKGRRAKTDAIDAALIAEFTAAFPESPPAVRDPAREQLAGLIRARRLVVTKKADLAKGLASAPEEAKPILEAVVAQLATAEEALETAIVKQVAADTRLAQLTTALVTAPGVGPVTAATLAAVLPELGHTTGAKIAALVGVAPFADDSGEHQGKRRIAGGRGDARRALYMAALCATRTKGVLGEFYRRLVERGKPPKVALTACMRKLVVRLNAMVAAKATWQEHPA